MAPGRPQVSNCRGRLGRLLGRVGAWGPGSCRHSVPRRALMEESLLRGLLVALAAKLQCRRLVEGVHVLCGIARLAPALCTCTGSAAPPVWLLPLLARGSHSLHRSSPCRAYVFQALLQLDLLICSLWCHAPHSWNLIELPNGCSVMNVCQLGTFPMSTGQHGCGCVRPWDLPNEHRAPWLQMRATLIGTFPMGKSCLMPFQWAPGMANIPHGHWPGQAVLPWDLPNGHLPRQAVLSWDLPNGHSM